MSSGLVYLAVAGAWVAGLAFGETMKPNRLIREKSPYLLQHAYNPVDWHAWGQEAFTQARKQDKPIFLSIGYSTCHWCHVMERESFSNPQIAEILNRHFVAIKVDREERPDVDRIYMTAVQAMTGSGGWPLNVFLTPDLQPFFGGTYFPPEPRWGQPGLPQLLERVAELWKTHRQELLQDAGKLTAALKEYTSVQTKRTPLKAEWLRNAYDALRQTFDDRWGGFGRAPKFPMPVNHNFLLRYYARTGEKDTLEMVLKTLREMARGGIFDQIGGGFHRYSTDERWFLPHFEKMLYDNAQLAVNYLEAFQACGDLEMARVARETLDYVLRQPARGHGRRPGHPCAHRASGPKKDRGGLLPLDGIRGPRARGRTASEDGQLPLRLRAGRQYRARPPRRIQGHQPCLCGPHGGGDGP